MILLVAVLGAVAFVALLHAEGKPFFEGLERWFRHEGTVSPLFFVAACVVAAVALVPGSLLKMSAGALFGLGYGTLLAFVGSTLGAIASFAVARYGARRFVETRLASSPRAHRFDASIKTDGFKMVCLLRLSPLVPYNLINYVLGLSAVRVRDYIAASPAMLPSVFLYAYTGKLARDALGAAEGATRKETWEWVLLVVGLVATIAAARLIALKARKAAEAVSNGCERRESNPHGCYPTGT